MTKSMQMGTALHAAVLDEQPATKWSELAARYPNMGIWNAGGNCLVARLERDDGKYMLFTNEFDAVPDDSDAAIFCGHYDTNGCINDFYDQPDLVAIAEVEAWIDCGGHEAMTMRQRMAAIGDQSDADDVIL